MNIFITGDTHIPIDIQKLNSKCFPEGKSLTKDDFVIICGDFGLVWDYKGWSKEELYWKDWLEEKPWTTLFIDGNHENFDRLNAFPVEAWNGGKIHKISDSIIHLMRGQVFEIEDKKIFTFGGARSTDRGVFTGTEETDRGVCWWDAEMPLFTEMDEGRENLAKHNWEVDYIITHDLPSHELLGLGLKSRIMYTEDYLNAYLEDIRIQTKYSHWYAGHHHMDIKLSPKTTVLYQCVKNIRKDESCL